MINIIRKEKKISVDELSLRSGVAKSTLAKITAGITKKPRIQTVQAIAKVLGCPVDLFSDDPLAHQYSIDELNILEKYRKLDVHGKSLVSIVVDHEIERSSSCQEVEDPPVP